MKLLDRYILKELLGPFVYGLLAFTFILAGSTVLPHLIKETVKYQIPATHLAQLIILKLPYIIAFSFPMAILLATILGFGRLGNDLELLAFRASGISIVRIIIPVIALGFVVSFLHIWFNESIVPKASYAAENLYISYRDKDKPSIKENINFTEYDGDLPSRIINVAEVEKGLFKSVTVAEYDKGKLIRLVRAHSGRWLPEGGWEFFDGIMHYFPLDDPRKATIIDFKKEYIDIQIKPVDLKNRRKKTEEMTRKELKHKIALQKRTGQDPIKNIMEYHMKLSLGFASLIYCILGASVGLRPHRSSSAMGFGISLLIIFAYIILMSVGMGLGLSHILPPLFAAWLPNILTGIAGLILLNKVISQ